MARKLPAIVCAAFVITIVILIGFPSARSTAGQKVADKPEVPGHYQLALAPNNEGRVSTVVLDTVTGQMWSYLGNGEWQDHGSPLKPLKVKK